jgi:hypothetical protein
VRIVWEQSAYIGNAPVFCTICDRRSYPLRGRKNQLLFAVLYDEQEVAYGEVCRDCVAAGSEGIRVILQERIAKLRSKLEDLQHFAQSEICTPTLEEEFYLHQIESP